MGAHAVSFAIDISCQILAICVRIRSKVESVSSRHTGYPSSRFVNTRFSINYICISRICDMLRISSM